MAVGGDMLQGLGVSGRVWGQIVGCVGIFAGYGGMWQGVR